MGKLLGKTAHVSQRQKDDHFDKWYTLLPSIFMTGVHPPSPHPKSPM